MSEYRALVLDEDDHVLMRHDFEAENGTAALELPGGTLTDMMWKSGNSPASSAD